MHIITWIDEGSKYKLTTHKLTEVVELIESLRSTKTPFKHVYEE